MTVGNLAVGRVYRAEGCIKKKKDIIDIRKFKITNFLYKNMQVNQLKS